MPQEGHYDTVILRRAYHSSYGCIAVKLYGTYPQPTASQLLKRDSDTACQTGHHPPPMRSYWSVVEAALL